MGLIVTSKSQESDEKKTTWKNRCEYGERENITGWRKRLEASIDYYHRIENGEFNEE